MRHTGYRQERRATSTGKESNWRRDAPRSSVFIEGFLEVSYSPGWRNHGPRSGGRIEPGAQGVGKSMEMTEARRNVPSLHTPQGLEMAWASAF